MIGHKSYNSPSVLRQKISVQNAQKGDIMKGLFKKVVFVVALAGLLGGGVYAEDENTQPQQAQQQSAESTKNKKELKREHKEAKKEAKKEYKNAKKAQK